MVADTEPSLFQAGGQVLPVASRSNTARHTAGDDKGVGELQSIDLDAQVRSAGHCAVHLRRMNCLTSKLQWRNAAIPQVSCAAEKGARLAAALAVAMRYMEPHQVGKRLSGGTVAGRSPRLQPLVPHCQPGSGATPPGKSCISSKHLQRCGAIRSASSSRVAIAGDPVPESGAGSLCIGRCQCRLMVPASIAARSLRHSA